MLVEAREGGNGHIGMSVSFWVRMSQFLQIQLRYN